MNAIEVVKEWQRDPAGALEMLKVERQKVIEAERRGEDYDRVTVIVCGVDRVRAVEQEGQPRHYARECQGQ